MIDENLQQGKPSPLILAKWDGDIDFLKDLDGVKMAPLFHHVTYENDQIRILSIVIHPGEEEEIHTHNFRSVLWFTDYSKCIYTEYEWNDQKVLKKTRSFVLPEITKEDAIELPAEGPHTVKNVGDKILKLYRLEFKK